jgi:hypothetical protein
MNAAGIESRLRKLERGDAGPEPWVLKWADEMTDEEAKILAEGAEVIRLKWLDELEQ